MPTALKLPIPPSTNNLYVNVRGRGRVRSQRYATWANAAGWEIKRQHPEKVSGAISLDIAVQRKRSNADVSNRIKAVEDLLVHMGVIDDDKHVQSVTCRWADIEGCEVTITPIRDVLPLGDAA